MREKDIIQKAMVIAMENAIFVAVMLLGLRPSPRFLLLAIFWCTKHQKENFNSRGYQTSSPKAQNTNKGGELDTNPPQTLGGGFED